jgi:phosphohistidine swiveling domain-containing protein
MFLSEKTIEAWRLITKGLHGGTNLERIAQDVLDGKLKFVGNETDGINAVPDNDSETEKYCEEVRYIFAGRCRIGSSWWRPRAKVEAFGPDDAHWAMQNGKRPASPFDGDGGAAAERFYKMRVQFYACDGERSVGCQVGGHVEYFVFEPCGEPPWWWDKQTNDPTKALEDFLAAGRHLQMEGYAWRGATTEKREPAKPDPRDEERRRVRRAEEDAEEDAEADAAEASEKRRQADLRARILEQAAGDLFELKYEGGAVTAPRAPFVNWALHRTTLWHLAPPWRCVSPPGLKLINDDPYHSDWYIGAGLDLKNVYDGKLSEAASAEMFRLQEEYGNFECAVIVGGEEVTGVVGREIVVLPDLRPERLEKLLGARAIITEAGGKMAHLAQIALERSIPIVLVPDACARYPEGARLTVSSAEGKVTAHTYVPSEPT